VTRVFVSHASKDREYAGQLHRWIVVLRHEVFLAPDGIAAGEQWRPRLHERLRGADAVVCVVTSTYVASTWCTAEIAIAQSRGSLLIPVLAESGVAHPLLTDIQHIDGTRNTETVPVALDEALRRVDPAGGRSWPDDRSPFPGLRPFEVEQHRVFFGRVRETEQLAELVRSPAEHAKEAVLLVVGPSGCGKSSLVRAGLLHVMANEPGWLTLPPILPGADPVAALTRELVVVARRMNLSWTVHHIHDELAARGLVGLANELLLANPDGPGRRLLIVIDQFEELLTQIAPAERARFVELLRPALAGPVQVVGTLRPEFLDHLLADSHLAALTTTIYPLRPLQREALRLVIEGPPRLAGINIEDDLVARLVEDTNTGDALPLLAFTLAQLADGVRRGGQLSRARYDQLGGVHGALTHQADAALSVAVEVGHCSPEQVIAGLLRLVTVDEQGHPTRWRINLSELPDPVVAKLGPFVTRRLLTIDTDNGSVVIGAAHEAFLSTWAPLARAIDENVSALRARRAIEQAATEWASEGRPPARLWERGQLATAVADTGAHLQAYGRMLVTDRVELSTTAGTFLHTSILRDYVRRAGVIAFLSVLLVVAVVAAVIFFTQQRTAEQQRDVAVSRQVAGQITELRATNPALAAQLALAAYRLVPTTDARGSLLSTLATSYATRLTGHTHTVNAVAFSPDRRTLATASFDKTARLWDISDPHHAHQLAILTGHTDGVRSVAFSPDGRTLATGSFDTTVRLWDISNPRHPNLLGMLTGLTNTVGRVAFSPAGHTLATAIYDGTVRLWDVSDPRHPSPLGTLTGHTDSVFSVAFSPDGKSLATASADRTTQLWDISDPRQPHRLTTLTGHTGSVIEVAFSPNGRTLATASTDRTTRLWDVSDSQHPDSLGIATGHTDAVFSVAFNPDGHTLATGSADTTARLWDISDPRHPNPLETLTGHTDTVHSVAFSPDGHTLATGSYDDTTRLWDLPGPILASHTQTVFSVAFSPDGRTLATGSADRTARLWDISDPRHPNPLGTLTGHTDGVFSVAFSPNGHTLATGSYDRTARLWDISDPRHPNPLGTLTGHSRAVFSLSFSPDGHTLATGSYDTTARLWDISDPRHPNPLSILTGHKNTIAGIAFSPDGHTLATASTDTTTRLWDVNDPRQPHQLGTLTGHTNGIRSVAFSPDGHTIATASYDRTARLWDVSDPRHPNPLGTLTGHTNTIYSVAFSPDGHTLATGSTDTTARLWETNVESVAAQICTITPTITKDEWDRYLPGLAYRPPCR
jgi:WD40 repeat protein/energy-coupling factor transporter ATP-binding protein EcfA2